MAWTTAPLARRSQAWLIPPIRPAGARRCDGRSAASFRGCCWQPVKRCGSNSTSDCRGCTSCSASAPCWARSSRWPSSRCGDIGCTGGRFGPQAVYTRTGWLVQERRIAPISRVQTVDTYRGPLDQLFGLANVTVTTASSAGAVHIVALDVDVADQRRRAADRHRGDRRRGRDVTTPLGRLKSPGSG